MDQPNLINWVEVHGAKELSLGPSIAFDPGDNRLVAFGDSRGFGNSVATIDVISGAARTLEAAGKKPTPRKAAACTLWNNLLVVFGGINPKGDPLNDCHVLDLQANLWRRLFCLEGPPKMTDMVWAVSGDQNANKSELILLGNPWKKEAARLPIEAWSLELSNVDFSQPVADLPGCIWRRLPTSWTTPTQSVVIRSALRFPTALVTLIVNPESPLENGEIFIFHDGPSGAPQVQAPVKAPLCLLAGESTSEFWTVLRGKELGVELRSMELDGNSPSPPQHLPFPMQETSIFATIIQKKLVLLNFFEEGARIGHVELCPSKLEPDQTLDDRLPPPTTPAPETPNSLPEPPSPDLCPPPTDPAPEVTLDSGDKPGGRPAPPRYLLPVSQEPIFSRILFEKRRQLILTEQTQQQQEHMFKLSHQLKRASLEDSKSLDDLQRRRRKIDAQIKDCVALLGQFSEINKLRLAKIALGQSIFSETAASHRHCNEVLYSLSTDLAHPHPFSHTPDLPVILDRIANSRERLDADLLRVQRVYPAFQTAQEVQSGDHPWTAYLPSSDLP